MTMAATVASITLALAAREGGGVYEGGRQIGGVAGAAGGQRHHQIETLDRPMADHHQ